MKRRVCHAPFSTTLTRFSHTHDHSSTPNTHSTTEFEPTFEFLSLTPPFGQRKWQLIPELSLETEYSKLLTIPISHNDQQKDIMIILGTNGETHTGVHIFDPHTFSLQEGPTLPLFPTYGSSIALFDSSRQLFSIYVFGQEENEASNADCNVVKADVIYDSEEGVCDDGCLKQVDGSVESEGGGEGAREKEKKEEL